MRRLHALNTNSKPWLNHHLITSLLLQALSDDHKHYSAIWQRPKTIITFERYILESRHTLNIERKLWLNYQLMARFFLVPMSGRDCMSYTHCDDRASPFHYAIRVTQYLVTAANAVGIHFSLRKIVRTTSL